MRFLRPVLSTFAFTLMAATASRADDAKSPTLEDLATKTDATVNKAPAWTKGGILVYRIATPDAANVLPLVEQELAISSHLLDGIHQNPFVHGVVGHDHPGICNWDGLWPYWDRVTFRGVDWKSLHDFMQRVKDQDNTTISFHVNFTDVNAGLRDYPESQAFFQKLVATKSMYVRDRNPVTKKRDLPPYVLPEIPENATAAVKIVSIVDYKNFYDSGLGKQMIDDFYRHLPYAPPLLYIDVLSLTGSNLNVGYPDGPMGGSEQTQLEGILNLIAYVNSKGSSVAGEGDRPLLTGKGVTYGWLHCQPGYSTDDYSYIAGTTHYDVIPQVAGNTGCFDVAPSMATPDMIAKVRDHYANLLAGKPDSKKMPGLETWHIADRTGIRDEFDLCQPSSVDAGFGGDAFRGDVADLINNFYLMCIQELYHIGKGNVRTAVFNKSGTLHVSKFGLKDSAGKESFIGVSDCAPAAQLDFAKKSGYLQLEQPLVAHFNAPQAGTYQLMLYGGNPGNGKCALNVYVNDQLQQTNNAISFSSRDGNAQPYALKDITLQAGDNTVAFDAGPIYMKWSDGTESLWSTPYLRKGFKVTNGDVTFADDYDRMWPDTWSGQKKIYFFSWDGTNRTWKLPSDWAAVEKATLYPLTPDGRGTALPLAITDRSAAPKLLPQIPYVLIPQ